MPFAAEKRAIEPGASKAWARSHIAAGLIFFIAFLVTGLYLRLHTVWALDGGTRILYRSRHIYLLLAALLNLLVGVQYRESSAKKVQRIGSVLVLIAPAILFAAFFLDPQRADLNAPLSHVGIFTIFGGSVLLAWANRKG